MRFFNRERGEFAYGRLKEIVSHIAAAHRCEAKHTFEYLSYPLINDAGMSAIVTEALTKNIILIGMPGCGKSTVGASLAHVLNRPFVDIDDVIESRIGMTICDFFKAYGEKAFRKIETAAPRAPGRRPPDFNVLRSRTSGERTSSPLSVVEGCFRQIRKSGGNDAQYYLASASAAANF